MEKAITIQRLAFSNIKRKPYRTAALIAITALAAAVLFASFILSSSLKGGISGFQKRLGADLMIVPEGYGAQVESVLLTGEPNYFYMDKNVESIIRNIEGVEKVSGQFYLTSLSESCCDFPIQIIGFDPESDFIVTPWAAGKIQTHENSELIFAGNNVSITKNQVTFFSQTHHVSSKLSKSGSGMDNAIYADLPTLQKIFDDAKAKGFGFISEGDTTNKTSVIFVKLLQDAKQDGTALRIKTLLPDVQIIKGGSFISSLAEKIESFLIFPKILTGIVLLISTFTLAIVFSLIVNERKREYSILRVLGADKITLRKLIFSEAFVIGSIGAATGIFLGALVVLPFNTLIAEKLSVPFVLSSPVMIIIFAFITFAISVFSSVFAAVFGVNKVSEQKIW
ncbi:MAG: ABC transporter permease [Spirochaetales bacterium]|nr:ABC transporter permease [Spirochaetales bacterium]